MTPCYLLAPTGWQRIYLRRFGFGPSERNPERHACPAREPLSSGSRLGCEAVSDYLDPTIRVVASRAHRGVIENPPDVDQAQQEWPNLCDHCHEPFTHDEHWQTNGAPIYRVTGDVPGAKLTLGMETPLRDAPPGAMWFAEWTPEAWQGPENHSLIVRLPDWHDWIVDSVANNCTRKDDRAHKCWPRRGAPPFVTVDKSFGPTCDAGAGSIQSAGYHGFLRNGILT